MKGVCAVVGCGPGLGASVALRFAREGFAIAALNRTEASFSPTRQQLAKMGARFAFFQTDASNEDMVRQSFQQVRKDLGAVNVLVYNCGGGGFGQTIMDINPKNFVKSFEVSCLGALLCTQAVLPGMLQSDGSDSGKAKKKGTIIYSSATSAFRGGAKTAQFACGKHALRALSQSVAKEYGKQGIHSAHVRLDCVLDTPGYRERYADMYAANMLASTDDIAETYYSLYKQSPLAWSNEIDIRPFQEGWSC